MNKFKQYYLGLKFVFSYFTVIPMRFKKDDDLSSQNVLNSMLYFLPFVGFVLGFIVVIVFSFLSNLTWLGAIISAVLYMFLYGFIHTEAILDVIDAIYAKHGGKDAYKVIKDPTVGAMGVLYSVGFVLIKVAAITYLLLNSLFLEFISVLILSRYILIFSTSFNEFKSSFLNSMKDALSFNTFIFSTIFTLIMSYILIGTKGFLLFFLAIVFSIIILRYIKKTLKFLNGDALGMTLELTEILLFIVVCYLWL